MHPLSEHYRRMHAGEEESLYRLVEKSFVRYDESFQHPIPYDNCLHFDDIARARSAADLQAPSREERPCYQFVSELIKQIVPKLKRPLIKLEDADPWFKDSRNKAGIPVEVAFQILNEPYAEHIDWSCTAQFPGNVMLSHWLNTTCTNKLFDHARELRAGRRIRYAPQGTPVPRQFHVQGESGGGPDEASAISQNFRTSAEPIQENRPSRLLAIVLEKQLDAALRKCVLSHLSFGKSQADYGRRLPFALAVLVTLKNNAIQMRENPLFGLNREWQNRIEGDKNFKDALYELAKVPDEVSRDILIDVVEQFQLELVRESKEGDRDGAMP